MSTIDERIVSMKFDNADFEKGVSQTLDSLNRLNKSIDENTKSNKAFDGLQNALDKLNFSKIGDSIENISDKFNVWGVVGAKVVTDLTGKVEQMASKMIKSLSGINEVSSGWSKFGEKTQNVATLVSQGFSLDTVTNQLEKLMWYTDETSYDFSSMVQNIGKFTAAGQGLEDSVIAMEGIANWAASAGQNASTCTRAMYQLSQAMSKGALKQDEYKPIQNASMDTQEFRQKCIDAAISLGTLKKVGKDTYETLNGNVFTLTQFTNQLTEDQWLSSDVMMKVFSQYAEGTEEVYEYIQAVKEETGETITASEAMDRLGYNLTDFKAKVFITAQEARTFGDAMSSLADAASSSWLNVFELIFGNYEEAKTLWTGIANGFNDFATIIPNSLGDILSVWKDLGGRTQALQAFVNILNAIYRIIYPIKKAFADTFGDANAWGSLLKNITAGLEKVTSALKINTNIMAIAYSAMRVVFEVAKAIFKVITPKRILAIGAAILTVKSAIAFLSPATTLLGKIIKLVQVIVGMGIVSKITKGKVGLASIVSVISKVIQKLTGLKVAVDASVVKGMGASVWNVVKIGIKGVITVVNALITAVKTLGSGLSNLNKNFNIINNLKSVFSSTKDIATKFFNAIVSGFKSSTSWVDKFVNIFKNVGSVISGAIGKIDILGSLTKFFTNAGKAVNTFAGNVILELQNFGLIASEEFNTITANGQKCFSGLINWIGQNLSKIPYALEATVKTTFNTIKSLFSEGGFGTLEVQAAETDDYKNSLQENKKLTKELTKETQILNENVKATGKSVGVIGTVVSGITGTVSNVANKFGELSNNLKAAASSSGAGVLGYISQKLEEISGLNINWGKILGIVVILAYFMIMNRIATMIQGLSGAINTFAKSITPFSKAIKDMVTSAGKVFNSISTFFNTLSKQTYAKTFRSIAISVGILATSLGLLSLVDPSRLWNATLALAALAGVTSLLTGAATLLSSKISAAGLTRIGAALLTTASAVLIFSIAMGSLAKTMQLFKLDGGGYDWAGLAVMFGGMASELLVFVGILALVAKFSDTFKGTGLNLIKFAGSLIALSVAILALRVAISTFSTLIANVTSTVKDFVSALMSGDIVVTKDGLINGILTLGTIFEGVILILSVGTAAIKKFVTALNQISTQLAKSMLLIAGSVLIIAYAMKTLSEKGTWSGVAQLGIAVVALGTLMVALKKFNVTGSAKSFSNLGKAMIEFSASLLILSLAIKGLSKLDLEGLKTAAVGVGLILGFMLGFVLEMKLLNKVNIGEVAGGMLSLVISMYLLLPAFIIFGALDFETMVKGMGFVAAGILTLASAVALMKNAVSKTMIGTIAAMSVALTVMCGAIMVLAEIDTMKLAKGLTAVVIGLIVFAASVSMVTTAIKGLINDNGLLKVAAVIGAMAGAVIILSAAIRSLSSCNLADVAVSALSLSGAMLAMSASLKMVVESFTAKDNKTFLQMVGTILSFAGAVLVLGAAIALVATQDIANIVVSTVALSAALYMMCKVALEMQRSFQAMDASTFVQFIVTLAASAGSMIVIAAAIRLLGNLPWTSVSVGAVALSVAFIAMGTGIAVMAKQLKNLNLTQILELVGVMLSGAATMAILSAALNMLAAVPFSTFLGAAGIMVVATAALSALLVVMDMFGSGTLSLIAVLISASAAFTLFAVALKMLVDVPWTTMAAAAGFIVLFAVAVGVLSVVFTTFAPGAALVVTVMVTLCAVLISFGAAAVLFGIGATLVGIGATLMATAFTLMSNALITLIPYIEQFITYIVMMSPYAEAIANMAAALTNFGIALGVISVAGMAAGVAIGVISLAMTVFTVVLGLFTVALTAVTVVFALFVNQLQQFLTFVSGIAAYQETLNALSTMISNLGKSLIVFGAGAVVAAAGVTLLSLGITAFGKALTVLSAGLTVACTAFNTFVTVISSALSRIINGLSSVVTVISRIPSTIVKVVKQAAQAGVNVIAGFINGIKAGIQNVAKVGSAIGTTVINAVKSILGIHSPSTVFKWLGDMTGLGFLNGIGEKMDKTGSTVSSSLTTVEGPVNKFVTWMSNKGKEAGGGFLKGLADGLGKFASKFGIDVSGITTAVDTVKDVIGGDKGLGDVFGDFEDYFNLDDFVDLDLDELTEGLDEVDLSTEDLAGSMGDLSDATSGAGSAASSAAKSTAELAEEQKALAKYTAYSNAVINTFANAYGGALELLGESSAIDTASAAFETLFNKIYEESSDASDSVSDSTEEATDKVLEMKKAFNEAFESIASTVEDSIDVFSEFDKGLDSMVKPEKLIENYKSQVSGIEEFYQGITDLAFKGFSDDVISDLIEEGTSAYPKVMSMLQATTEQVEELNKAWDSKEALGYQAAISAMTARMTAIQMESFKKTVAARKAEKESLEDAQKAYKEYAELANKAYGDNKDIAAELQDENSDLAKSYKTLTEAMGKAGLTSEDLQKAMESGEGFEEQDKAINDLNESLDAYRELAKKAAEEGTDIAEESIDNTTELGKAYEALMTKVEAAGFTVENLYSVMANDSSFVNQTDYVEGLINVYNNCEQVMSKFKTMGSDLFDNVKESLDGAIGYFSEWDDEFELTTNDLMTRLQANLQGITQYKQNIATIISNGGTELLNLVSSELTPEIAAALANATAEQIATMTEQVKLINQVPLAGATEAQNNWMQYGTIGGVTFNDALNQSLNAQQILATMGIAGQNVGQGLANGMSESTGLVTTQAATMAQALVDQIHTSLDEHSPSRITTNSGQNIDQGLINGMQNYRGQVINTASLMCTSLISEIRSKLNQSTFAEIGRNCADGLANGINSGASGAISAAVNMAVSAYQAAKNALDVNSPSREFAWLGKMSDAGFANGFEDNASLVENAVTDTMKSALATACDLLSSDMDVNPTITPIIDLSDAQNGAELLSSMFTGQSFGFTTNAELGHITTNAERMNNMLGSLNAGNTATYGDTNLYIYGSQGQNVNQLADIVINRLNNEYARRKAAWS